LDGSRGESPTTSSQIAGGGSPDVLLYTVPGDPTLAETVGRAVPALLG